MNETGKELSEFVQTLETLSNRFMKSDNLGMFLKTEDAALFTQSMMEATAVIDDLLGAGNRYNAKIFSAAETMSVGFIGGPSFAAVQEIKGIILAAQKQIDKKQNVHAITSRQSEESYISVKRLAELKQIRSAKFDLTRLIRLCEELNLAHINQCYMSIAMIVRAIIDHIPPIFDAKTFSEVANNYNGGKSFKKGMERLDVSLRESANTHLHAKIRKKEVLPDFPQVNFRSELDSLLGEIIRILKE